VVYENPLTFWRQSNRWVEWETKSAEKAEAKGKPVKAGR
jgi:hypothetical protein